MQFTRRAIIGITCAVICAVVAPAVHADTLPAGYAQLTYIESTGTQYVDTECVPTRNFRAVVDLAYTTTTGGGGFGYGAAGSAQSFRFWRTVADGVATYKVNINDKYGTENHFPTTYLNDTGRHVVDISDSAKSFDDVRFGDTSGLTKTLAGSFYLFALRWGWNPYIGGFGSYRVYSCKLYEGTTLVRDFVPCVDGNGKGGLYDLVNGKMYYNKATGDDFVLGPATSESLAVAGETLTGQRHEFTNVSPAYGFESGLAVGEIRLCTAPSVWTNATSDAAVTCVGYKVYTNGVLYVEGNTTSFTYVHPAANETRLVWLWDLKYRVSVTAGPGGTVSTSGAWLRPGESLAIDAVPDASHEFCRWSDNVNAVLRHGHEAFAIGGDSPLKITAIFGGHLYVDGANGDDATADGTTPATAYKTIGAAVSAAPSNTVVLVADGTYKPSALISISKAVTVRSLSGVAEGVKVDGNAARHCFTLNHPQACLDTITIQNGKSDGSSYDYGVNVRIAANGGQVRNCIVRNGNHANFCTRDNGGGAGIGCVSANGIVVGCVITNNQFGATSGTQQGVGLYMKAGTVVDSFIGYNKATSRNQNVPGVAGAFLSGSARMANCTVAGNNGISAGGVDAYSDNVRVYNTFIWGNVANADGDVFVGKAGCFSNCVARYAINGLCRASASSCASGRLYAPNPASPCIDASVAVPGIPLPPRDILGNPRVSGAAADIGAVEFQSGTPQVALSLSDASFICPREVTLTAATSGIEGIVKYVWDFDGDGVDDEETTVPHATHSYDTPAYSTPRVTVVHAGGSTVYTLPANSVKALPRTAYVNSLSTSPAIPYATPETAAKTLAAAVADAIDGQEIVLLAEGSPYSVTSETSIRRGVTVRGSTGNPADVVYRRSSGNTRLLRVANPGALVHSLTLADASNGDYGNSVLLEPGTLSNCVVRGTTTAGYWSSAAVYANGAKSLVTHCVLANNNCANNASSGGNVKTMGLHLVGGARAANCLIAGGKQDANCDSTSIVGGAYVENGHLLNCTIVGNSARNIGGVSCANGTVSNCVIAANVSTHNASAHNNVDSGQLARYFHCASDEDFGETWATGSAESLFAVYSAGDYSPAAGSALVDGGAPNAGVGTEDLAGNKRVSGKGVDIGCYEYDSDAFQGAFSCDITSGIVPVSITFSATADGTNGTDRLAYYWDWDGDGVTDFATETPSVVRDYPRGGNYSVSLTISNLTAGTAAPAVVKDRLLHLCAPTIYVRTSNAAAAFPYDSWETASASLQAAVNAAIDGVAIVLSNGTHNVASQVIVDRALDIRGLTGNPADVTVYRTGASDTPAGYKLDHPQAVFRDMTFDGGTQNRPGILIAGNGGTVTNCVITRMKNFTHWASDGALTIDSRFGLATHCVITNNNCTYLGDSSKAIVRVLRGRLSNSLIARNTQGVAVPLIRGAGIIDNCTVVSNTMPAAQALLASFTGGMTNCLFAANVTGGAPGAIFSLGTARYSHNLADVAVDGWLFGSAEEIFFSPATCNWRLLNGDRNPARNKGDRNVPFPSTDLDGAPRLVGGPDIGCYENQTEFRTLILLR